MFHTQLSLFDPPQPNAETAPISPTAPIRPATQTTVYAASTAYQQHLTTRNLSPTTLSAMSHDLAAIGAIIGNQRPVGSLTEADAYHLVEQLQIASKPATVARRLTTYNGFVTWLRRQGVITGSLRVTVEKVIPDLPRILTRAQVQTLLDWTRALTDPRPALLVRLALLGLKRHEIAELTVDCIGLTANQPYIEIRNTAHPEKTRRVLAQQDDLLTCYAAYANRYSPLTRVFPVTDRQLENVLTNLAETLTLPLSFGTLRWTAAKRFLDEGLDPERLRHKLGLSSIVWETTLPRLQRLNV